MNELELFPPEVEMTADLNLKMRVRVLGQVLYELINVCGGKNCEETIEKGIIKHQIVESITISFVDFNNIIRGEIEFQIDWERLEFLAKTNEDIPLINKIDLKKLIAPQFDKELYQELDRFVQALKKKYRIKETIPAFRYRSVYRGERYERIKHYLGHITGHNYEKATKEMNYELRVKFQNFDKYLDIIFRN